MKAEDAPALERRRLICTGAVQGVGFRPFVYLLAQELSLTGTVKNTSQGAEIEIQGLSHELTDFESRLLRELPAPGRILRLERIPIDPKQEANFSIQESQSVGAKSALILPDLAPCAECLAEIADPEDRRYGYPFTNCTHCGPRYSIIRTLPYDRRNTTMAGFKLCRRCLAEYENPVDRRFHAQPTACPSCGPHLELWSQEGAVVATHGEALELAAQAIERGKILALKGIGGFHLMVDARNEEAVLRLRTRKRRESKPLAVMTASIDRAYEMAEITIEEAVLLRSPAAPILIVPSKAKVASSVAPENPNVGLMLPSSPLHALLLNRIGFPVIATSGNLSGEPLCIDEHEALTRLQGIADLFLVHNRPIGRPIDDSICRHLGEGIAVLRRARGFTPLRIEMPQAKPGVVAYGAQFKGSIAVTGLGHILVGQHVGDLDNVLARDRLEEEVSDLCALQETSIQHVVHDLHPDYASTQLALGFASASRIEVTSTPVQHHLAHATALMQDREVELPFLAVVWDGTGLGSDGSIWGGEFLLVDTKEVVRVARLRPFTLPGGDATARQGFKSALSTLFAAFGEEGLAMAPRFTNDDDAVKALLQSGKRCAHTTSAGRLFDAAAALGAGILNSRFEGDAAMRWEALASMESHSGPELPIFEKQAMLTLDWVPLLPDLIKFSPTPAIGSRRFHQSLASGIARIAHQLGIKRVGLTGGCFQNRLLSRLTCEELRSRGLTPIEHREIPPNDGGIAFGQVVAAVLNLKLSEPY